MGLWNGFDVSDYMDLRTIIMALDFGHGQCSAYYVSKGNVKGTDLYFDNEQTLIPTALYYSSDGCKIGRQAAGKAKGHSYFKDSPCHFEVKVDGVTKKKMMEDFLEKLMQYIINYNRKVLPDGKNSKILLLVGCPSDYEKWISQKMIYADMIETAMKKVVRDVRVVIMPESRAAFINATKESKLLLNNGVLVLDFGSSTADYTWMQIGKKTIEGSWRLGAFEIETNMLRLALRDYGDVSYGLNDLSVEQHARLEWQMRCGKEIYFNGGTVEEGAITIYEMDGNGNRIKKINPRNGVEIDKDKEVIRFSINEDFMKKVFYEEQITVEDRTGSWAELSRSFVRCVIERLKEQKCMCKNVVLAGGASKMKYLREICEEEFGNAYGKGIQVKCAENPSYSVSRGLAVAAENEIKAEKEKETLIGKVSGITNSCIEKFIKNASEKIAEQNANVVLKVMGVWASDTETRQGERTRNKLSEKTKQALAKECSEDKIRQIMDEEYRIIMLECRERLQKAINEKMEPIYNSCLDRQCYQLDDKKWNYIVEKCDIADIIEINRINFFHWGFLQNIGHNTMEFITTAKDEIADFFNEIFYTDFSTDNEKEYNRQLWSAELSEKERNRLFECEKQCYKQRTQEQFQKILATEIKDNQKSKIAYLAVDALEEAFDIMAFYG